MNIAGIDFDLNNQALEIFVSGCSGVCPGCHNESLWDFNVGKNWKTYKRKIHQYNTKMIQRFFVMGGEPLEQDDLESFLIFLSQFNKEICLWTRFLEIPENIKKYLSYAKIGEYKQELESYEEPLFGITLASTNQTIIKIK